MDIILIKATKKRKVQHRIFADDDTGRDEAKATLLNAIDAGFDVQTAHATILPEHPVAEGLWTYIVDGDVELDEDGLADALDDGDEDDEGNEVNEGTEVE